MKSHEPRSTLDRTLTPPRSLRARRLLRESALGGFLRRVARSLDFTTGGPHTPETSEGDDWALLRAACHAAVDMPGKMAGLVAIAKVADAYNLMDAAARTRFFLLLEAEFEADPERIEAALAAWRQPGKTVPARPAPGAVMALMDAVESPRMRLFRQFNTIPAGIKFLVDLREDLQPLLQQHERLQVIEHELQHLLTSWFNLGFLQLTRITWSSPAVLLEKLVQYEAVHEITNWRDLKHRLISDRACYAFIHPHMADEPVIFVEVALVHGIAGSVQELLDPEAPNVNPEEAETAVFYSISNAQQGLRGIPFGNLLIKKVAAQLAAEMPNLRTFVTLSPLPRFRGAFLDGLLQDDSVAAHFTPSEAKHLLQLRPAAHLGAAVQAALAEEHWHQDAELSDALRPGLLRAARAYLTQQRYHHHAACPVAHFHGSNGARLERLNWLGDTSAKGLRESAGIMANYLYDMERFEQQQTHYAETGAVESSKAVNQL